VGKTILKITLVILGILTIYGGICLGSVLYAFGVFDKTYTTDELVENYNRRKVEIEHLKHFFNQVVPNNKFVEIEFKNDSTIYRLGIGPLDSLGKSHYDTMFLEWDLRVNSPKVDSIIKTLGWTQKTLQVLKAKLDKADCIQIESGEPAKIGFKRSGLGMYFYNVFEQDGVPDSLITHYNDSCTYIFINKKLVLEYGGGAVGDQCFSVK
jgi:hypothetical protein